MRAPGAGCGQPPRTTGTGAGSGGLRVRGGPGACGRRPRLRPRVGFWARGGLAHLRRRGARRGERRRGRHSETAQESSPSRPGPATHALRHLCLLRSPAVKGAAARRRPACTQSKPGPASLSRAASRAPRGWRAPAGRARKAWARHPRPHPTPAAARARPQLQDLVGKPAARPARHRRVDDHHVDRRGPFAREPQRLLGAGGGQHAVAELLEQLASDLTYRRRALGHEHGLATLWSGAVVRERHTLGALRRARQVDAKRGAETRLAVPRPPFRRRAPRPGGRRPGPGPIPRPPAWS